MISARTTTAASCSRCSWSRVANNCSCAATTLRVSASVLSRSSTDSWACLSNKSAFASAWRSMSRIGAICLTKSSHRSTAWRSRSLRKFLLFSAVLPMPLLFHRSATTSMASCSSGSSMSMASRLSTCLRMASAAGPVGSSPLSTVLTSGWVAAIWARVAGSIFFLSSFSCGYGCLRAGDGRQKYVFVAACCSEMLGRHNAASTGVPAAQAMRAMRAVRTSYAAMSAWQRCTRTQSSPRPPRNLRG